MRCPLGDMQGAANTENLMLRTLGAVAALTLTLPCPAYADGHQTLLENAAILDVETGNIRRGQNVLIEAGKIAAI